MAEAIPIPRPRARVRARAAAPRGAGRFAGFRAPRRTAAFHPGARGFPLRAARTRHRRHHCRWVPEAGGEGVISLTWEDNGCLGSQNLSPRHNQNLRKPWKQFRVLQQIPSPDLASAAYRRRCVYRYKEAGGETGSVHPCGSERGCSILNWTGDLVFSSSSN